MQLHVSLFWKYYNILWCESLIHCITGIDSFPLCMQSRKNFLILRARHVNVPAYDWLSYFTGRIKMPLLILPVLRKFYRQNKQCVYNIIKADHPYNQKRGGLHIYFREQLKLKQLLLISLNVFFVRYQWGKNGLYCCQVLLPQSNSYYIKKFDSSFGNFWNTFVPDSAAQILITCIILGEFNARSKSWWKRT